jgi:ribonuclease E
MSDHDSARPEDSGSAPTAASGPTGDQAAPPERSGRPRRRGSRGGRGRGRSIEAGAPQPGGATEPATEAGSDEPTADTAPANVAPAPLAIPAAADPVGPLAGVSPEPLSASPEPPSPSPELPSPSPELPSASPELPSASPESPSAPPSVPPAVPDGPDASRRPQIGDTRPAPSVAARPRIGDTRPAPPAPTAPGEARPPGGEGLSASARRRRRRSNRSRVALDSAAADASGADDKGAPVGRVNRSVRPDSRRRTERLPVEAVIVDEPAAVDQATLDRRRGRERKGRPVGRYLMVVHVGPAATQIAVLEGKSLIEHYVSRPADDANEIDGNIYLGRVQNVLPGMEAAFVDIGTPKNAVLYRGDVRYDRDDVEAPPDDGEGANGIAKGQSRSTRGRLPGPSRDARIEQLLRNGQMILCQVTKNPIGHKGARLTQEVSLPGRFVVLIPGSDTYGISKRLPDEERKRLRRILDEVRPEGHGLIVRTAAEGATADELRRDVLRLKGQWDRIDELAKRTQRPGLLYREPGVAVRVIREEFNRNYRGVVIDDPALYEEVRDYVGSISPELADRVEFADPAEDPLPVFERHHVHEQIHKALDRKVWLPSGGSLIIERTEALTVIDVNTGKNVGSSNLEETVFRNNLEAADEIARQLRLRDIGGIIVIDFIDMEIAANRNQVVTTFREALARDKTRTQVFDISELGLVEMTRKRVSEGLVESFSEVCPTCGGRGIVIDQSLL